MDCKVSPLVQQSYLVGEVGRRGDDTTVPGSHLAPCLEKLRYQMSSPVKKKELDLIFFFFFRMIKLGRVRRRRQSMSWAVKSFVVASGTLSLLHTSDVSTSAR